MEISALLVKSSQLMLVGMIVVFSFLSLLIVITKSLSSLVLKWQLEPTAGSESTGSSTSAEVSPQTVAAISAAIHQYRQPRK